MPSAIIAVSIVLFMLTGSVVSAQEGEPPVCTSVAVDADGDGFGCEHQQSCWIDVSSAPKPE